jgi:hypothetical protein
MGQMEEHAPVQAAAEAFRRYRKSVAGGEDTAEFDPAEEED